MSACFCFDGNGDENDEDAEGSPSCAEGIHHGQETITKGAYNERNQTDGVEDEEELPVIRREIRMVHCYCSRDERRKSKVDGESDGPISYEPDPTGDEREHRLVFLGDLKGPVVRTGRGRIS